MQKELDELKMQLSNPNRQKQEQEHESQQPKGELVTPYLHLA